MQISPHHRFRPTADFTPPQMSPRIPPCPRSHTSPDFTPPQISPNSRFHPSADLTGRKMSPHPRFHPAPDFITPQISPCTSFHGYQGSTPFRIGGPGQIDYLYRFWRLPIQILGPTRGAAPPDTTSNQKMRSPRFHPPAESQYSVFSAGWYFLRRW